MKHLNAKTVTALPLTGAFSVGTVSAMGLDSGVRPLTSVRREQHRHSLQSR